MTTDDNRNMMNNEFRENLVRFDLGQSKNSNFDGDKLMTQAEFNKLPAPSFHKLFPPTCDARSDVQYVEGDE